MYGVHINSLGSGHTHKHTYRRPHRNNFKNPGMRWPVAGMRLEWYLRKPLVSLPIIVSKASNYCHLKYYLVYTVYWWFSAPWSCLLRFLLSSQTGLSVRSVEAWNNRLIKIVIGWIRSQILGCSINSWCSLLSINIMAL